MAPPSKPPATRRQMEPHMAAGIGIPMVLPLGRNLFPGWPAASTVYHRGFLADGGSDGLGFASHRASCVLPSSVECGGGGVRSAAEVALGDDDGRIDDLSQNMQYPISGTMTGGGPFMDMLLNATDLNGPAISSSQLEDLNLSPTDGNDSEPRQSQKRSKNFSEEENILLVSAWLNVSMDAIHGTDQSKNTYWGRICKYFHENKTFDSTRTQGSLANRWSGIQLDVNKFAGCVDRVEARNPSGHSIQDKLEKAKRMFKEGDKDKRSFPYMHCYDILKNEPKWKERRNQKPSNKKRKSADSTAKVVNETPNNIDDNADGTQKVVTPPQEKPGGRKFEKNNLRKLEALNHAWEKKKAADAEIEEMKQTRKEERNNKTLKLEEDRISFERERFEVTKKQEEDKIALEKEKLQIAKKQEDERLALDKSKFELTKMLEEERIINLDISEMSTSQQEYYKKLKTRILSQNM